MLTKKIPATSAGTKLQNKEKPAVRELLTAGVANDPNCDTNEPPLVLGGSLCAKGVHELIFCWHNLTTQKDMHCEQQLQVCHLYYLGECHE